MTQTDEALAKLAAKLGVSAQYLWQALMAQQRIEGIIYTVLIFFLLAIACLICFLFWKLDEDALPLTALVTGSAWLIAAIGLGYWAITDLMNPAYASLYEIMQHIK